MTKDNLIIAYKMKLSAFVKITCYFQRDFMELPNTLNTLMFSKNRVNNKFRVKSLCYYMNKASSKLPIIQARYYDVSFS